MERSWYQIKALKQVSASILGKTVVIINPVVQTDAILKVTSTCICGSDLHLYLGFVPGMEPGELCIPCHKCVMSIGGGLLLADSP